MSARIKPIKTDVIIIGGGIMGAAAALFLRQFGRSVILFERGDCGASASGINFGGVRRQGRPLCQLPLAQRAHSLWADLPNLIGHNCEYVRSGHLKIAQSEADQTALEQYLIKTKGFGLDLSLLSARELRARCPGLSTTAVIASLCPDDGHANPRLLSPAFAFAAKSAGADIREHTPVSEAAHDGEKFIVRSNSDLEASAPYLLNCAGAWAGEFAGNFGDDVPMEAGHPQMLVTEPLPAFLKYSLGVEGGGIYARQVARGNCIIGGGRGYALDADHVRAKRANLIELMRQTTRLMPALKHAHIIRTWSGTEGFLPDRLPVIGPSRTTPGLFHAFGFAGGGFQLGPAVGAVLSELVVHGHTATPIEAFSLSRFSPEVTGAVERPSVPVLD